MARRDYEAPRASPVVLELEQLDKGSAVALVGHPLHVLMVHFPIAFVISTLGVDVFYWWSGDAFWARVGLWSAGMAFWTGLVASIVGTAELLLVPGMIDAASRPSFDDLVANLKSPNAKTRQEAAAELG